MVNEKNEIKINGANITMEQLIAAAAVLQAHANAYAEHHLKNNLPIDEDKAYIFQELCLESARLVEP